MALKLRGGGSSHISDVAIYGGAGLTLVDAVGEFIYPELVVADAKDADAFVWVHLDGEKAVPHTWMKK